MNRRKITLFIGVLVFSLGSAFAQITVDNEGGKAIQEAFGKERRVIVSSLIDLQGEDSVKFWSIYDSAEVDRLANGDKRFVLYKKYQSEYNTIGDKETSGLVGDMMKIVSNDNKRILSNYSKISKSIGVKTAGQYYQLEMYLQATTRLFYLNQMEFIGEK